MIDERLRPWRLRTPAQAAASRTNGSKSRGPRTVAGKEASSQNARQHGLRSVRMADDERVWLAQLCDEFRSNGSPMRRSIEQIEQVAAACLRLERAALLFAMRAAELGRVAEVFGTPHGEPELSSNASDYHQEVGRAAEHASQSYIETLNDLQRILRYERRFRGQRDRVIRRYLTN